MNFFKRFKRRKKHRSLTLRELEVLMTDEARLYSNQFIIEGNYQRFMITINSDGKVPFVKCPYCGSVNHGAKMYLKDGEEVICHRCKSSLMVNIVNSSKPIIYIKSSNNIDDTETKIESQNGILCPYCEAFYPDKLETSKEVTCPECHKEYMVLLTRVDRHYESIMIKKEVSEDNL